MYVPCHFAVCGEDRLLSGKGLATIGSVYQGLPKVHVVPGQLKLVTGIMTGFEVCLTDRISLRTCQRMTSFPSLNVGQNIICVPEQNENVCTVLAFENKPSLRCQADDTTFFV
jgi:hypothetical protein